MFERKSAIVSSNKGNTKASVLNAKKSNTGNLRSSLANTALRPSPISATSVEAKERTVTSSASNSKKKKPKDQHHVLFGTANNHTKQLSRSWNFLKDNGYILAYGNADERKKKRTTKEVENNEDGSIRRKENILMLNGGRANVPDHAWKTFLSHVVYDLLNGIPVYFTEVAQGPLDPRRLGSDMDYIFENDFISTDEILQHVQTMQTVVDGFFPHGNNSAIVLMAEPKRVQKRVKGELRWVFKVGVHVIWPHTIVNEYRSLRILASWLSALEMEFGKAKNIDGSWATIVDEAIYAGGLRLPGSSKCHPCKGCAGNACESCQGAGRIYEHSKYLPKFVISSRTHEIRPATEFDDKPLDMLWWCCVRKVDAVLRSDYVVPHGAPVYTGKKAEAVMMSESAIVAHHSQLTNAGPKQKNKKKKHGEMGYTGPVFDEDKESMAKIRCKTMFELDSPEAEGILEFTRTCLPIVYSKLQLRCVWSNKPRTRFWASTHSSFCQNINREHLNNTIYLYMDAETNCMYQKCWCSCQTTEGRKQGKCEDYKSGGVKLSLPLQSLLFQKSSTFFQLKTSKTSRPVSNNNTSNNNNNSNILSGGWRKPGAVQSGAFDLRQVANELAMLFKQKLGNRSAVRVMQQPHR